MPHWGGGGRYLPAKLSSPVFRLTPYDNLLASVSDVEAVAVLLKRFVGLEELQQRRRREEEADFGEEEEDSLGDSSHSEEDEPEPACD